MAHLRLVTLAVVAAFAVAPSGSRAWDNFETHPALASASFDTFSQAEAFDRYLWQYLGVQDGAAAGLVLRRGVDDPTERDLAPKIGLDRIYRSTNATDLFKATAADVGLEYSEANCDDSGECRRYSLEHLIRSGAFAEDVPNERAQHHFHDPDPQSPARLDNTECVADPQKCVANVQRGLNDRRRILLGVDVALAQALTPLRGGNVLDALRGVFTSPASVADRNAAGSFDLRGVSAQARAMGEEDASEEPPENLFSIVDAERYLYRALTASTEHEREHYLALHFIALGHVVHLLQDMTSPAHTRNDFLFDHVPHSALEGAGDKVGALELILSLAGAARSELLRSRPQSFLQTGGLSFASFYDRSLPAVDASQFALRDFFDRGTADDDGTDPTRSGLAQFVHDHFLSAQSQFDYARPDLSSANCNQPQTSPVQPTFATLLPLRAALPAAFGPEPNVPGDGLFISSRVVPYLARCKFLSTDKRQIFVVEPPRTPRPWHPGVIDETVQRSYMELLFPLAIDYVRQLMIKYLAPRIEVLPRHGNRFQLANLTREQFRASTRDLAVYYDDEDGERQRLGTAGDGLECEEGLEAGDEFVLPAATDDGPGTGEMICTLPEQRGSLPAPANAGKFWVVVRGKLGDRGEVVEADADPEEDFRDKDFVVAFAPVDQGVLYGFERYGATDDALLSDVAFSPIDLSKPVADMQGQHEEPETTLTVRVSDRLRRSAGDDFVGGVGVGPVIAMRTDRGLAQLYEDSDGNPLINGALSRTVVAEAGTAFGIDSLSVVSAAPTKANTLYGGPKRIANSDRIWFVDFEDSAIHLGSYDVVTEQTSAIANPGRFPVGGEAAERLRDPDTGELPLAGCFQFGSQRARAVAQRSGDPGDLLHAVPVSCSVPVGEPDQDPERILDVGSIHGTRYLLSDGTESGGLTDAQSWIDVQPGGEPEVVPCDGGRCDMEQVPSTPGDPFIDMAFGEFSPDATKLAFVAVEEPDCNPPDCERAKEGVYYLIVVDLANSSASKLNIAHECVNGVTWLPDGERIAYIGQMQKPCNYILAEPPFGSSDVFIIDSDGSEVQRYTHFDDAELRAGLSWYAPLHLP